MKPDAIFWIASTTKPITSVAAMMLPPRYELSLEPQKRPMQVIDLLRHTAGFGNGEQHGIAAVYHLYDARPQTAPATLPGQV